MKNNITELRSLINYGLSAQGAEKIIGKTVTVRQVKKACKRLNRADRNWKILAKGLMYSRGKSGYSSWRD